MIGNRTEIGLLRFLENELKIDFKDIRENNNKIRTFPFSSKKKRMGMLIKNNEEISSRHMEFHIKGAPEIILNLCQSKVICKF